MVPSEPVSAEPEAAELEQDAAGAREVLRAFYEHLGAIAVGEQPTPAEQGGREWDVELRRAGHGELAEAWENIPLLEGDSETFLRGILDITAMAGAALRGNAEPPRTLDVALDGWSDPGGEPGRFALATVPDEQPDVVRLVNLLRVGEIAERREAALELGSFVEHRHKLVDEELYRLALETLVRNRDPGVALEVTESLARLSGSESRRARAAVEKREEITEKFIGRVQRYWDGELQDDPVEGLTDPDLVSLGIGLRRAPDHVAGHIAEYLLGLLARDDQVGLASVVSALVPSGDIRLLPVLVRILEDARLEVRVAAIKALAHIDDPRAPGALEKAFHEAHDTLEKVMIARALASFGLFIGADVILEGVSGAAPTFLREEALKAVGRLPDPEDGLAERLVSLVENEPSGIALAALRALSRVGDVETVEWLEELASREANLRAAALRAAGDLRARLALAGLWEQEEPRPVRKVRAGGRSGFVRRFRSFMWYLAALVFVGLRRWSRARLHCMRASTLDPTSAKGHFLEAYTYVKQGRDDDALDAYRRGLQVDPMYCVNLWGEADRVLETYLRRADALDKREGKMEEAIGLLEETAFIDLRSADPNLKIEVERRMDTLKLERRRALVARETS